MFFYLFFIRILIKLYSIHFFPKNKNFLSSFFLGYNIGTKIGNFNIFWFSIYYLISLIKVINFSYFLLGITTDLINYLYIVQCIIKKLNFFFICNFWKAGSLINTSLYSNKPLIFINFSLRNYRAFYNELLILNIPSINFYTSRYVPLGAFFNYLFLGNSYIFILKFVYLLFLVIKKIQFSALFYILLFFLDYSAIYLETSSLIMYKVTIFRNFLRFFLCFSMKLSQFYWNIRKITLNVSFIFSFFYSFIQRSSKIIKTIIPFFLKKKIKKSNRLIIRNFFIFDFLVIKNLACFLLFINYKLYQKIIYKWFIRFSKLDFIILTENF